MLTVIHTFDGPDLEGLLGQVRTGIRTCEDFDGFKFASVNQQQDTSEIMLFSKWENRRAFENWANTIGENNAFKSSTPQIFEVLEEKY
ncbi:putative enzyme involved in biosynthesis of extracellular polysaccharides [Desulfosporosinus acidiphilus SJ4]|uniref:Putative enzyme involved in biosynthesis of extracellular polysaccharides n=1 Tax=Desulfosporosinus acidiphilus (strain DSM 22704 / JCM 16185 / SJ4) TaxID=646529 RepID=I4D8A7_DESAJ|nr:antibiotic biosynthesis monooxygenase [Desulfosporosinus acidiphilus]AFM42031.1 putative enzyme involved in biosynthesis of extracellular polysaccharides [Desulfosporosinus acidiphilus SJ4]